MISIIVPVYNVENYLKDCINSIINQTYTNIEIILVDDGSTDSSGKICENYSLQDSRIKVLHKPNGGLSDARNYGIKHATGNEITFIDSDDIIAKNMIEVLAKIKHSNNAQMSVCFRRIISEDNSFIDKPNFEPERLYISKSNAESLKIYFESKGGGLVAWGKLYDISLFDNIRYPIGRYNEDVFTTYKLVAKSDCIAITNSKLYYYRVRNGSIMNRSFEKKHLDVIYGSQEMTSYIESEFPQLSRYPQILLIYATLQTAIRMLRSGNITPEYVDVIKNPLRKYSKIIFSNSTSLKAKILGLLLIISPIKLMRLYGKIISKFL